jgi:hypothetical protein
VRVFVSVLQARVVHMCVLVGLARVAVFVLVLNVFVLVLHVRVHVCHVAVLVFVAVRCVRHVLPRSDRGGSALFERTPGKRDDRTQFFPRFSGARQLQLGFAGECGIADLTPAAQGGAEVCSLPWRACSTARPGFDRRGFDLPGFALPSSDVTLEYLQR